MFLGNNPVCDLKSLGDLKSPGDFFAHNDHLDHARGTQLADYIPELEAARKLIDNQEVRTNRISLVSVG